MKKGVILATGMLAINATTMPMMTGMRRATNLNQFNRAGAPAFGAMAPGMLGGANNAIGASSQPTGTSASTASVPTYNPTQYFNPATSPMIALKTGRPQTQPFTPKIDLNADTNDLVNNLQPSSVEFKARIATRGAAGAIYGGQPIQLKQPNKTNRAQQLFQKRDFSVAGFQEMLAATITPELEKKYDLQPFAEDGITYKPNWKKLIQDGHMSIVKSLLQANLVSDKSTLLLLVINYCNPNDLHDILAFYQNDIKIINEKFEIEYKFAKVRDKPMDLSIDCIQQLVQAGLSHELQIKASLYSAEFGDYVITKALNPQWFAQEFIHQKNIMLQAPDLSSEQKKILQTMYETATINNDVKSATYQLTDQQIQIIAQSGLTFSQIAKYVPMQLFDTKKIFDLMNATITAQLLLKADPYLMKNMHHENNERKRNEKSNEQFLLQSGIYDKIINIEQDVEQEDYHTFVLGRNWNFNFVQDIRNLVRAAKTNASKMDNIIELTPSKYDDYTQNHAIKTQEHLQQRKTILQSGSQCPSDGVCLNSTIFENIHNPGLNTPEYVVSNSSLSFSGHTSEEIFEQFGILDKYQKYEKEIQQLKQLHKQSSRLGELLAVSIHKNKIDSLTFVARIWSKKYSQEEECKPSAMLEKLYADTQSQYHSLSNRPQDYYYYLAAPGIPGELGQDYKVQSIIHVTDQEKFAEYKRGIAQLFEKLKVDIPHAQDDSQFALLIDYCIYFANFHQHDGNLYEID